MLKRNDSVVTPVELAGSRNGNGEDCENGRYSDPYGTYNNVIVSGYVKITLEDYYATVNLETNQLVLRTGTRCKFNEEECLDLYGGYVFWTSLPISDCQKKYTKLFFRGSRQDN